jgi:two-component sensor histidine kinase
MMGVTTVSALLSRMSGSAQVPFDGLLRGLCDILAARFGRSGGPRLACVAADEALPIGAMTLFALIADLLVTDAFVHAFPPGRGGRVAVSFTAAQEAWQLTVDDSGIAVRSHGDRRDDGPTIARQLVLRLG